MKVTKTLRLSLIAILVTLALVLSATEAPAATVTGSLAVLDWAG